jgi:hypothetical protein
MTPFGCIPSTGGSGSRTRNDPAKLPGRAPRRGRLLLMENVIPPGNGPSFGKWLDLLMLVYVGGRERTADEFHDLLTTSGFAMKQVVPTTANVSVIEAVAL